MGGGETKSTAGNFRWKKTERGSPSFIDRFLPRKVFSSDVDHQHNSNKEIRDNARHERKEACTNLLWAQLVVQHRQHGLEHPRRLAARGQVDAPAEKGRRVVRNEALELKGDWISLGEGVNLYVCSDPYR